MRIVKFTEGTAGGFGTDGIRPACLIILVFPCSGSLVQIAFRFPPATFAPRLALRARSNTSGMRAYVRRPLHSPLCWPSLVQANVRAGEGDDRYRPLIHCER